MSFSMLLPLPYLDFILALLHSLGVSHLAVGDLGNGASLVPLDTHAVVLTSRNV